MGYLEGQVDEGHDADDHVEPVRPHREVRQEALPAHLQARVASSALL
jgi:hypothetical protein